MTLSVVDPINAAIERAKLVCFRPFDLGKWFTIGFCAFLAGFVEGSSNVPTNFNFGFPSPAGNGGPGGKPPAENLQTMIDWVQAHLVPIVAIGLIVLTLLVALWALFVWLGSRGQFMFLDNIARNRGAVVAPWREYRKEGNSLFWFQFLFVLAVSAVFLAILVGAVLIALPDIQARKFSITAGIGLAVLVIGFIVAAIVSGVIRLFLNDFVAPIMYLRRIGAMTAWREFYTAMLAGNTSTFVLYVLFKVVLAFGIGFLTVFAICCTLCIAFIPYLGSHVLLLPLHVFWRSYSLYFIEQFGPEWRIFERTDEFIAEFEGGEWPDEHFRPGDERIRPADDFNRPPDDRIRPE